MQFQLTSMIYNVKLMQEGPLSFKIILLGDSDVGKTCFIKQFTQNNFIGKTKPTCSVDFVTKTYQVDEFSVRLNIFDTAGQERFRSLTKSYFKGTDAVLFMYSLANKSSFKHITDWVNFFQRQSQTRQILKILVGTKRDLLQQSKLGIAGEGIPSNDIELVTKQEMKELIEKHKFVFKFETSSKTNTNICLVFEQLSRNLIYNSLKQKRTASPIREEEWSVILKRDKEHLLKQEERHSGCC